MQLLNLIRLRGRGLYHGTRLPVYKSNHTLPQKAIMATSAETLSLIIDLLVKTRPKDREGACTLLAEKGYLPKKLLVVPKVKTVSVFASKVAEDYALANDVKIPDGFKGTASKDKISVKDLKALNDASTKKKPANASPSALQFARDNGIDIGKVTGTGVDGKILLKDIKGLKPSDSEDLADIDSDKPKISPSAAKLMKRYELDEEDLADIVGTGANGTIVSKDLKELIDLIKADKSGSDSESD
jgi:pyruvate/2-oxoglutarate dehydrogenase complex dihydrolipoamide acyltransferase (E2) component